MFFDLSVGMAFLAGVASFLSPCVFALVPVYISYLSGRSVAAAGENKNLNHSANTFFHGLFFVLGFTVVFVLLGTVFSGLGRLSYTLTTWLVRIGGIVIVVFGLNMLGVLQIPWLEYDLRPKSVPDRNRGYLSSFLMGIFFSAGWSPCVGPVLGMILTLALASGEMLHGVFLLFIYSIGLGIPFLIAAMQVGWVTTILQRYAKVMLVVEKIMGVLMIIIGVMLFFDKIALFSAFGGTAFEATQEVMAGKLILYGILVALAAGTIPAYFLKRKGKNFFDIWFLATGILIIIFILGYLLLAPGLI